MTSAVLLALVTLLYAGYNVFMKVAGQHVPDTATTTVLATICVQVVALLTSLAFLGVLLSRGEQSLALSSGTWLWAAAAGLCIGAAEIGYLYLFSGIGLDRPMDAGVAIPTVVSGTVAIAMVVSVTAFGEALTWTRAIGALLVTAGTVLLFVDPVG